MSGEKSGKKRDDESRSGVKGTGYVDEVEHDAWEETDMVCRLAILFAEEAFD